MPERIALEVLQKVITKLYEVAGSVWADLKLKSRTSYVRCYQIKSHKAPEHTPAVRIN